MYPADNTACHRDARNVLAIFYNFFSSSDSTPLSLPSNLTTPLPAPQVRGAKGVFQDPPAGTPNLPSIEYQVTAWMKGIKNSATNVCSAPLLRIVGDYVLAFDKFNALTPLDSLPLVKLTLTTNVSSSSTTTTTTINHLTPNNEPECLALLRRSFPPSQLASHGVLILTSVFSNTPKPADNTTSEFDAMIVDVESGLILVVIEMKIQFKSFDYEKKVKGLKVARKAQEIDAGKALFKRRVEPPSTSSDLPLDETFDFSKLHFPTSPSSPTPLLYIASNAHPHAQDHVYLSQAGNWFKDHCIEALAVDAGCVYVNKDKGVDDSRCSRSSPQIVIDVQKAGGICRLRDKLESVDLAVKSDEWFPFVGIVGLGGGGGTPHTT